MIDVKTAATKELVAFYNENCEAAGLTPVKKFSDRETAERRVAELVDVIGGDTRSEGIKRSWTDPAVREARSQRHPVIVDGELEFPSVAKAFTYLNLDMKKHISFRRTVVLQGAADFEGHKFELLNKE